MTALWVSAKSRPFLPPWSVRMRLEELVISAVCTLLFAATACFPASETELLTGTPACTCD